MGEASILQPIERLSRNLSNIFFAPEKCPAMLLHMPPRSLTMAAWAQFMFFSAGNKPNQIEFGVWSLEQNIASAQCSSYPASSLLSIC
jgi:hypothetical protein